MIRMMVVFLILLFVAPAHAENPAAPITPEAVLKINMKFDVAAFQQGAGGLTQGSPEAILYTARTVAETFEKAGYSMDATLIAIGEDPAGPQKLQTTGMAQLLMVPISVCMDPSMAETAIKEGIVTREAVDALVQIETRAREAEAAKHKAAVEAMNAAIEASEADLSQPAP